MRLRKETQVVAFGVVAIALILIAQRPEPPAPLPNVGKVERIDDSLTYKNINLQRAPDGSCILDTRISLRATRAELRAIADSSRAHEQSCVLSGVFYFIPSVSTELTQFSQYASAISPRWDVEMQSMDRYQLDSVRRRIPITAGLLGIWPYEFGIPQLVSITRTGDSFVMRQYLRSGQPERIALRRERRGTSQAFYPVPPRANGSGEYFILDSANHLEVLDSEGHIYTVGPVTNRRP